MRRLDEQGFRGNQEINPLRQPFLRYPLTESTHGICLSRAALSNSQDTIQGGVLGIALIDRLLDGIAGAETGTVACIDMMVEHGHDTLAMRGSSIT